MNIPIAKPYFDKCEEEMMLKALRSGWVVEGTYIKQFEDMFSNFVNIKYSHTTTSCTTALHLGLEAMKITKGDKVIVPSFTYIASANAVEYTGAEVVFCDINLKTFNIDETKLEDIIKKDSTIKAIMPVNLFGLCADLPYITKLAKKYNIKVIEDSACGFDAKIGDKHSGTFGDIGCFSFHPRKSICTGEGGMLITNNQEISTKVKQLKNHGATKSDLDRHKNGGSLLPEFLQLGYNYRMNDIQGAIGVCQMKKQKFIMEQKRLFAKKYDKELLKIRELTTPYTPQNYIHGYQSYVCLFTGGEKIDSLSKDKIDSINIKRNIFMEKLEKKGISTRQGTHALHTVGYYKDKNRFNDEDFLMSYAADRLSIALPLYSTMTNKEFDYIIKNIKECI